MNGVNSIHLVGHLGADPELRHTANGTPVVNLSLATTHKDKTAWHRIVVFGQAADFAGNHLGKGDLIYVQGRLDYRTYADPQTAQERVSAEIYAGSLQSLTKKDRNSTGRSEPPRDYSDEDDLPF